MGNAGDISSSKTFCCIAPWSYEELECVEREQGLGRLRRQKCYAYGIETNKTNSAKVSAAKSLLGKSCPQ